MREFDIEGDDDLIRVALLSIGTLGEVVVDIHPRGKLHHGEANNCETWNRE